MRSFFTVVGPEVLTVDQKMSTEPSENLVQSCPENSEKIQSWAGSEGQ